MDTSAGAADLDVLCQFEIALRNALAWHSEARRVIAARTNRGPDIRLTLLDRTFSEVARLVTLVATVRDMVAAERISLRER